MGEAPRCRWGSGGMVAALPAEAGTPEIRPERGAGRQSGVTARRLNRHRIRPPRHVHRPVPAHRPVAAGRPLRLQDGGAAAAAVGVRPHAPAGAGRGRVVHRAVGRRAAGVQAAHRRRAACCAAWRCASRRPTRARSRTSRRPPNPRRQGRRVLAQGPLRGAGRAARASCARRPSSSTSHAPAGHQQHQPRADAAARPRRRAAAGAGRAIAAWWLRRTRSPTSRCSATHGQTASPTTLGKEIANVAARLQRGRAAIADVKLLSPR